MIRPNPSEEEIIASAAATWGNAAQIQMAYGECGEFITLAGRYVQNRASNTDFIDEIADIIIMMGQMRQIFGEDLVDARVAYKMDRLKGRILNSQTKES